MGIDAGPISDYATSKTGRPASRKRRGMPLALVIVRYFVYVLVAFCLLFLSFWLTFSALGQAGVLYYSAYAVEHAKENVGALESGALAPEDLPSCYRWAVFDASGELRSNDMEAENLEWARNAAFSGLAVEYNSLANGGTTLYDLATLPSGSVCVLRMDYYADFVSKDLRDTLPPPEALLIGSFLAFFVLAVALLAIRAAHVIARKMHPLAEAAARIEGQDLDFATGFTNVREINDVAAALDRMREALRGSLQARWAAEEAQRRQVAALAHDLKTPLAVARWNADLLAEAPLRADDAESLEDVRKSLARMEGYVALLVETSRGASAAERADVPIAALASEVEAQATAVCKARGLALAFSCDAAAAPDAAVRANRDDVVRAIMNLVANAADHALASSGVRVRFETGVGVRKKSPVPEALAASGEMAGKAALAAADDESRAAPSPADAAPSPAVLRVVVEDDGPGFAPEALAHATERFYTTCDARTSSDAHYGLGLSIAADIVAAHGGTLALGNRPEGGARCTLEIPLEGKTFV